MLGFAGVFKRFSEHAPRDALFVGADFFKRTFGNELAAAAAGAWSDVDHVIGSSDEFFVVFDHNDCVAFVFQFREHVNETRIVSGV